MLKSISSQYKLPVDCITHCRNYMDCSYTMNICMNYYKQDKINGLVLTHFALLFLSERCRGESEGCHHISRDSGLNPNWVLFVQGVLPLSLPVNAGIDRL